MCRLSIVQRDPLLCVSDSIGACVVRGEERWIIHIDPSRSSRHRERGTRCRQGDRSVYGVVCRVARPQYHKCDISQRSTPV